MIARLGKQIDDPTSMLYWAHKVVDSLSSWSEFILNPWVRHVQTYTWRPTDHVHRPARVCHWNSCVANWSSCCHTNLASMLWQMYISRAIIEDFCS